MINSIPIGKDHDAYQRIASALTARGLSPGDVEARFQPTVSRSAVEISSFLPSAVHPTVFGSLMSPILSDWQGRKTPQDRSQFWYCRRARQLRSFVPMSPPRQRAFVRGWLTANLLGHIDPLVGAWGNGPLQVWTPTGYRAFPENLLGREVRQHGAALPALLESLPLALLTLANGTTGEFEAYVRILELGMAADDVEWTGQDYREANPELAAWVLAGELTGASTGFEPPARGMSSRLGDGNPGGAGRRPVAFHQGVPGGAAGGRRTGGEPGNVPHPRPLLGAEPDGDPGGGATVDGDRCAPGQGAGNLGLGLVVMRVLLLPDNGSATKVVDCLLGWSRSGLLGPLRLVRDRPGQVLTEEARVSRVEAGEARELLLGAALQDSDGSKDELIACYPAVAAEGFDAGFADAAAAYVDLLARTIAHDATRPARCTMLAAPSQIGQAVPPGLLRQSFASNVYVAPEDRAEPRDPNRLLGNEEVFPMHAAHAIATVGDLWNEPESERPSVIDVLAERQPHNQLAIQIVRCFSRGIDFGYLPDHVSAGIFHGDGGWPNPDPERLDRIDDPQRIVAPVVNDYMTAFRQDST